MQLPVTLYTRITIAAKINHDVSLSVHEAGEGQRSDVAPYFEGSEESVIDDFLVQVGSVAEDSAELTKSHFDFNNEKKSKKIS